MIEIYEKPRALAGMHPQAQRLMQSFLQTCVAAGLLLLPYCGLRSLKEQARLFRQGRTAAQIKEKCDKLKARGFWSLAEIIQKVGPQRGDRIVTFAAPGESFHNLGLAMDAVLIEDGKPDWEVRHLDKWRKAGDIAKSLGLEWAGAWSTFREMVHFQVGQGGNPLKSLSLNDAVSRLAEAQAGTYNWTLGGLA